LRFHLERALENGMIKPARMEENAGAVAVELPSDDLREIESAASKIAVQGARYSENLEQMTHRFLHRCGIYQIQVMSNRIQLETAVIKGEVGSAGPDIVGAIEPEEARIIFNFESSSYAWEEVV
jgi:hypothetical protein